jgi:hypothetical protein
MRICRTGLVITEEFYYRTPAAFAARPLPSPQFDRCSTGALPPISAKDLRVSWMKGGVTATERHTHDEVVIARRSNVR